MSESGTTQLLEGKKSAAAIRDDAAATVQRLRAAGLVPSLALVLATADESAAWYTRAIARAGEKVGIDVRVERLADDASAATVRAALQRLSADDTVHGIILQVPLPPGVDGVELATAIAPEKDVDGANPVSLGRLTAGLPAFAPATAAAVLRILDDHGVELAGRRAVVVGRSLVVGKPAAMLLLARDATVTVCHSRTRDLAARTSEADVLVAAVGRPRMLGAEHVTPGAVVVDVGTTPDENGNLVGDVDAEAVMGRAGALTPVPGGVGPVTTALLLHNTVTAAARAAG
ncbi:MAG TPA: bifunctional 5,10-methylenetetrahydrofolate dehydrogenase/5,10-methenyltetrahydrofolate cyclohydrolase [Pseudonocardia sp.]|nr:bifunctional 5,10-methylenetetrahydrofolate dehydrogenase/5,10-methenyltetrahydrofolate cyclohydrolase [Pseudonocardia sp.]